MANHFDLEEQEQLDELKHFWKQYGNAITWVLIVALAAAAGWNGWQFWQRKQAAEASALFDEVDRAQQSGDTQLLERAVADVKDRYARTTYATQAVLLAAKAFHEKNNDDAARAQFNWVIEHAPDAGYQALARLRLSALQIDAKQYDDALKTLSATGPKEFEALTADRRGDIYTLQGKRAEAKAEYQKAWDGLEPRAEARRLIEVKLNAMGVDTAQLTPSAAKPASETAK